MISLNEQSPRHARQLVRFSARVLRAIVHHHALDAAAAMSFYFFLSFVPLLVILGLLLGHLVRLQGVETLVAPLFRVMPRDAVAVLTRQLEALEGAPVSSLAPLSLLGFLYLTSSGVHNFMDLLEVAAGAQPRPWLKQRMLALGWTFAALGWVCLLLWLMLAIDEFIHREEIGRFRATFPVLERLKLFRASTWEAMLLIALVVACWVSSLAAFYRFAVEHKPHVRRRSWPGAFVATVVWVPVSLLFGTYVQLLGRYALYYGSLAAVAVLLLWMYLTSLALLVGAEVNAQLEGLRDPPAEGGPPAGAHAKRAPR